MLCRRKQEAARSSRVDGGTEESLMVGEEAPGRGGVADAASCLVSSLPFLSSLSRKQRKESQRGEADTPPDGRSRCI